MNTKKYFLAMILAGTSMGTANATLFSEESFLIGAGGYTIGDIAGQNPVGNGYYSGGWFKGDPGHSVNIVANNLSYPGLLSSGGSLATGPVGRAGRNLTAPLNSAANGTYYISFLANFGIPTPGTHHRVVEAWSQTNLVGADGTRSLMVGYSTFAGLNTTNSLSINNGANGNETDFDQNLTLANDNGATHLYVLRFDLSDQPNGDIVFGYLDPVNLATEPGAPNAVLLNFDFQLAAFGSMVNFIFDGGTNNPTGYIDEIRFGNTYADVLPFGVPEPATFALMGLGAAGLVFLRRRRS